MKYDNFFIDSFLIEKQVNEGLSLNTMKAYKTVFNTFILNDFVKINDSETYTDYNFKRFLGESLTRYNWTSWTYNRYKKCLKCYCDFLIREGYLKENPLLKIKTRKIAQTLPKFYNQKQVDLIMYTINRLYSGNDFISVRNRTIIYFYFYTGLRLHELIDLKLTDLNFEESCLKVVKGKGSKDRFIPIIKKLENILFFYLDYRSKLDLKTLNLFTTKYDGVMQHRDIYTIINKLKSNLDFPLTTHMFRHTFATELARNNINIFNIAQILGHSKIETTKIYLNFNLTSVANSINAIDMYNS
ncbi:MAG: tyrosine-type recombinase/integrase [Candidatus Gracilibacteria bacterium]|nr:tyrosine-type recombinase/integrase [Candidatus Gracilibacteria bacterium]